MVLRIICRDSAILTFLMKSFTCVGTKIFHIAKNCPFLEPTHRGDVPNMAHKYVPNMRFFSKTKEPYPL